MPTLNRKRAGLLALGLLVLVSGCAQVAVHSTVAGDGTIDEYRLQINTSRTAYGYLDEAAEAEGYDSIGPWLLRDVNESAAEDVAYDETFDGDRVSMEVTITGLDPTTTDTITVERSDGRLVYEDLTFVNESALVDAGESENLAGTFSAGTSVDYYLTMPGKITDSNADEVDGKTAAWHESGRDAFVDNRIYAESEVPVGSSLSVPGFGAGVGVVALGVVAFALRRR